MAALHLDHIRRALSRHRPELTPWEKGSRRAAVALILSGDAADLDLCFIRRAERDGDPWSGHMAFPGGRAADGDATVRDAAERETREEVGLVLERRHGIGTLSDLPVRISGVVEDMVLSSFVYYLGREPAPFTLDRREVAEAFRIPLSHLWDADQATHFELDRLGHTGIYPGVRFRGHVIWGLTFRLLGLFSDVLDHPLPHLEEIPGPRP